MLIPVSESDRKPISSAKPPTTGIAIRPLRGHPNAMLAALSILLVALSIMAAPASAQEVEVGGYYPDAITTYVAGSPGFRTQVYASYCHGSGSWRSPEIQITGGGANRSPAYLGHDQTVWYRAWVARWNGSTWAYYGGGRAWQSRTIRSWQTTGAAFWGENVTVATGSWYRIEEQYVFAVNGAWIGEAHNVFNQWAYQSTGASLVQASGSKTPSSCLVR
jgi:hypothetical protein